MDPHRQDDADGQQPWYLSHAETIVQNVVGQLVAFVLLWAWGISGAKGLLIQASFFVVSYARGYCIRRLFDRWGHLLTRFFSRST